MSNADNLTMKPTTTPTWFEEYFPWKSVNPYIFWGVVGTAGVLTSLALRLTTGARTFLFPFVPLSLGIILIPIATRMGYNILLDWEKQVASFVRDDGNSNIEKWYQLRFMEGARSKRPFICGLLFNIPGFLAFGLAGTFNQMTWFQRVVTWTLLFLINFLCGVALCSMWFLAKLVWHLGKNYNVHVSRHSYGVTSTGPVMFKVYFLAASVWFTISLSAYRSDYSWVLLVFLAIPVFIFLCTSFILIQFPLHKRMKEFKRKQFNELERVLAKLLPENLEDCTAERRAQIEFYHRLEDAVDELPDWPFRLGSYLAVIGASLGAIAPTILSYLLQATK